MKTTTKERDLRPIIPHGTRLTSSQSHESVRNRERIGQFIPLIVLILTVIFGLALFDIVKLLNRQPRRASLLEGSENSAYVNIVCFLDPSTR